MYQSLCFPWIRKIVLCIVIAILPTVLVSERAEAFEFRNDRIRLCFDDSELCLHRVVDLSTGTVFNLECSPMWRLNLYDTSSGYLCEDNLTSITARESGGARSHFFTEDSLGNTTLVLTWNSIPLLEGGSVEVSVTLYTGESGGITRSDDSEWLNGVFDPRRVRPFDDLSVSSRWDIKITDFCDSLSVFSFDFPFLEIPSFAGNPGSARLAVPNMSGILVPNPVQNACYRVDSDRDVDDMGKEAPGKLPGMFGIQFSAIYETFQDELSHGLFFSTDDTTTSYKRYAFRGTPYQDPLPPEEGDHARCLSAKGSANEDCNDPRADFMQYYVRNYPLFNMSPGGPGGKISELPYSAYVLPFTGDWLTASKIYRAWAIRQPWTSQGRLFERADYDTSYAKKTGLVSFSFPNYQGAFHAFAAMHGYKHWLGDSVDICVRLMDWYDNWPTDTVPKDSIDWLISSIQNRLEFSVVPYIHTRGWGADQPDDTLGTKSKAIALNANGDPFIDPNYDFHIMDPSCLAWRRKIWDMTSFVQSHYRCKTVYLDNHQGFQACCRQDGDHDHTPGSGSFWLDGFNTMLAKIRKTGKNTDPEFSMIQEGKMEGMIPYLDMYVLLYWEDEDFNDFYVSKGFPVPILSAVYHDYLSSIGSTRRWWSQYSRQKLQFTFTNAYSFVNGNTLSLREDAFLLRKNPETMPEEREVIEKEYWKLLARYSRIGLPYLRYGEFMRPPAIDSPTVVVEFFIDWLIHLETGIPGGKKYPPVPDPGKNESNRKTCETGSVLGGAFLAPDSTLGVFMTNFTGDDVDAGIDIDLSWYGMDPGTWIIEKITLAPPHYEPFGILEGSKYHLEMNFPKRSVVAFRIRPSDPETE